MAKEYIELEAAIEMFEQAFDNSWEVSGTLDRLRALPAVEVPPVGRAGNGNKMIGLSDTERQILLNQAAIMAFLHGTFETTEANKESYIGLYVFYQTTIGMLDADAELKEKQQ